MRPRSALYTPGSVRRLTLLLALALVLLAGGCSACASGQRQEVPPVGQLVMSQDLRDYFDRWHARQEVEQALALYGRRVGLVVVVEGFDATETIRADTQSVRYRFLSESHRVIGTIHTHPGDSAVCVPSDTDIRTLYSHPTHLVSIVACGRGRFGAVLRGSPEYHTLRTRGGGP